MPAVTTDIFDSEQLLHRVMGDRALAIEIVNEFVADVAGQTADLQAAALAGDARAVARRLHTIKGASANVGATQISRIAKRAEDANIAPGSSRMNDFISELNQQIALFKEALEQSGFAEIGGSE